MTTVIDPDSAAAETNPTTVLARRTIDVPVAKLTNGHQYGWDFYASDHIVRGPVSDHCYFWYDSGLPTMSTPTSNDFKLAGSTKHVNDTGTISVKATDPIPSGGSASGIDFFQYSFSSESTMTSTKDATVSGNTGTANISYTPTAWGMNYLYVRGVDKAGNPGPTTTYKFYVPDDPNAAPRPGDVDGAAGDGSPDLLGANATSKNLELYSSSPTSSYGATPKLASNASNAPSGAGTWGNTLIAHRASSTTYLDDLWAKKAGTPQLTLYKNNANTQGGITGHSNLYYTTDNTTDAARPSCDPSKTTCDSYYTADWSKVTQLIAPGDVNGDGNADLITVENNAAWFFHGGNTNGELLDPRLLTASAGAWRFIAPGNNDGTEPIRSGADCDTDGRNVVTSSTPAGRQDTGPEEHSRPVGA